MKNFAKLANLPAVVTILLVLGLFQPTIASPGDARLPEGSASCIGTVDDCGVCNGPGKDICGVCDGDGTSCLGCDGAPNSGLAQDECGACGGSGANECGCDVSDQVFSDPTLLKDTNASATTPADQFLHSLNEQYDFKTHSSDDYHETWPDDAPLGYKWLKAGDGTWFYLKPDGTLWQWAGNGTDLSNDTPIARLDGREDSCGNCWGPGETGCDNNCGSTATFDLCGECGGDNSSCAGCDGVPNSGNVNDACGVCDGDNSSCTGCDGVVNSGKVEDDCGVCDGDNSSCAGCDGVANSGKINDACGVCDGDNSSCVGCDGVPNSGKANDACGVCDGDGTSCLGCDGVTNSGKVDDACGVCDGPGENACGCDISDQVYADPSLLKNTDPNATGRAEQFLHSLNEQYDFVANATDDYNEDWPSTGPLGYKWLRAGDRTWFYIRPDGTLWQWAGNGTDLSEDTKIADFSGEEDDCGQCWGPGKTGCDQQCGSSAVDDACGECGGDGTSCIEPQGCDGVVGSGKVVDLCGVCGGDNSSCAGCDGLPNSGTQEDDCGVCGGDGTSCIGCDGNLNSNLVVDDCGVCGGGGPNECGCDISAAVYADPTLLTNPDPNDNSPAGQILRAINGAFNSWIDGGTRNGDEKWFDVFGTDGTRHVYLRADGSLWRFGNDLGDRSKDTLISKLDGKKDSCGRCWGPGPGGCDNSCNRPTVDQCGVCGGDGSSCVGCDGVLNSGVKLDACGICGGDGSCVGCDGVPNSGVVKDLCGVCGGSENSDSDGDGIGDSCDDNQCVWAVSWSNWSGIERSTGQYFSREKLNQYKDSGTDTLVHLRDETVLDASESLPGCFTDHWNQRCDHSKEWFDDSRNIYGWCGTAGSLSNLANFLGVPSDHPTLDVAPGIDLNAVPDWLEIQLIGTNKIKKTYYMDENCNWVENKGNADICGFGGVSWSPVSLILDDSVDIDQDMQVVQFSLTGRSEDKYALWKASEKAPLLVFDPEDTGRVDSAAQLFGNYAFGGKTTSPVAYQGDQALRTPWENGFEAMAVLDHNADGELSGSELQPIKLWFDANRDAKVDDGELRSLKSEGIVALYFREPKEVTGSKDVALEIGYKRITDGKAVTGKAIDWYGESFSSASEALSGLGAMFNVTLEELTEGIEDSDTLRAKPQFGEQMPANDMLFEPGQSKNHKSDVTGFWYWTTKEKEGQNHPGVFAFKQTDGRKVYGYTVVESVLEPNSFQLRSAVVPIPLLGDLAPDKDGQFMVSWKTVNYQGGLVTSKARLIENGSTLVGRSTQTVSLKKGGKEKSASFSYDWVARKVISQPGG